MYGSSNAIHSIDHSTLLPNPMFEISYKWETPVTVSPRTYCNAGLIFWRKAVVFVSVEKKTTVKVAAECHYLVVVAVLLGSLLSAAMAGRDAAVNDSSLGRRSFPPGFIFGTASSAYQFEGGATQGGRGPSIWDTYTHKYPEKISDHSNGDVADDSYNHYKEDVAIMKEIGFDAYRFSISWSRVLPKGKVSRGVNKEGVEYYNNLIDELLSNGIQPWVTIFHWDLPQALEDEYGGFLSSHIVEDFAEFAEFCFREFGKRVKRWITINEPWSYSVGGYAFGNHAPGRCSGWMNLNCTGGDSATEPYIVSHHLILAHAAAANLYKQKYQASQHGIIGITLNPVWVVPYTNAKRDEDARSRLIDFTFGWFVEPLTKGDYPSSMRRVGRLPKFAPWQSKMVKGSFDFLGLNYYTSNYVYDAPMSSSTMLSYKNDAHIRLTVERNGVPIGPKAGSAWLCVYPRGLYDVLIYINKKYDLPLIYITENGIDEQNNDKLSLEEARIDHERIDYHRRHLQYLSQAIKNGVNVKGYFVWSLLDNFEWAEGYTVRFGINYVDFKNGLRRYHKASARWFNKFLEK